MLPMTRTRSFSLRSYAAVAEAIVLAAVAGAGGATILIAQDAAVAPEPVVREAFATGSPVAAPGQQLQLVRYVIQPGTTLPPHTHPGMQIARVESGTLRYTLVAGGETPVHRKGTAGGPGAVETLRPGQNTIVHPGDTVIEAENVVHFGASVGEEPVVIWAAALLRRGEPASTVAREPEP